MPLRNTFFAFLLVGLTLLVAIQEANAQETYDGRPPDAFSQPLTTITPVTETCDCWSSDGGYHHICTITRPPEMRTCLEVCIEQANEVQAVIPITYNLR